jgi:lactoylglutathione lyase
MDAALARLAANGIAVEAPVAPDGSADSRTAWVADPDGNRIELGQWPRGNPDGLTAADWCS